MTCTDKTKTGVRSCNLGSARGLVRQGGELVAITHKTQLTGWKAPNAYGAKPIFSGETTAGYYNHKVVSSRIGAQSKKKLMPYSPNAPRNRPKESLENILGPRYGPHPSCVTEKYKGESHLNFLDSDPDSKQPWRTTNQVFSECAQVQDTIGLANAGISSDVAMRMHKRQGIYA